MGCCTYEYNVFTCLSPNTDGMQLQDTFAPT